MGLCLGPYGGPRGGAVSYERGDPVHGHSNNVISVRFLQGGSDQADQASYVIADLLQSVRGGALARTPFARKPVCVCVGTRYPYTRYGYP